MADNYVQIRIKATDTAKPDLTSLKADLDELGRQVDTAQVDVDDADAKRKLLEVNAELARLNKRVASSRIDVAGAAKVESDLEKVSEKFDELREKADKAREHATEDMDRMREHASKLGELVSRLGMGSGLLGKLMFGSRGGEGAAADAEKAVAKVKDSVGGIVGLLRQLPGGGGAEGGGSALGILGNLSGLSAGGAGAAFGIGAILVELDGLVSGFAAAGAGAGAFALLAMPAFEKVKGAIGDTHAKLMKLDPDERQAVYGIRELEREWKKMSTAFEPDAFKVFNQGLKIANNLLPLVKPFADTFANSLDGLLKQADKFTQSKGFEDWLKQFHKLEGPAVTAIGQGIGHVAVSMGKLLTIMSSKDVVNSINIAFKILSGTIDGLGFVIRRIMLRWDQWQKWFDNNRHAVADWAHNTSTWFDRIRGVTASTFDSMRHKISSDFDGIRHEIGTGLDWIHGHFRSEWDAVAAVVRAAWSVIRAIVRTGIDFAEGIVRVGLDLIHGNWAKAGQDLRSLTHTIWGDVGRIIRTALSALPGELYQAGVHMVDMLANGIRSAIGDVTGAIGSVVSEITSHLPFSPAKKGPLSGRGDPTAAGRRISQMLAQGMDDGRGAVSGAADRMAGAASTGAHGGRGGGTPLVLEFHVPTALAAQLPPQFWTAFANGIRAKGGSAGLVTRKVKFA